MTPYNLHRRLRTWSSSHPARGMLFFVASLVAACAANTSNDVITFSHNLHTEQDLACADCHGNVQQDAEKKVVAMKMSQCADCHDVEDKDGCKTCHSNAENSKGWQRPAPAPLLFSHQTHEARDEDSMKDCASCHAQAATATTAATRSQLMPGHAECSTCHKKELTLGACDKCHDRLDLYDMAGNDYFSHEPGFFERHGTVATAAESNCALCHDQTYCTDCHNKSATVRPSLKYPDKVDHTFMHSGDWMSKHALESKANPASCLKCHGVSYCTACHNRNGIGAGIDQDGTGNPHPSRDIWLSPGPQSHGAKARREILTCASCHDQGAASNCVNCHQEKMGINPHPPGWRSSIPNVERESHPTCRICHN